MILKLKRFKALGLLFLLQASVVLTSCGGPRMTPPEVIKGLYQILNDSHVVMERGNVQYWVDGGTLIGAVRHQGIVPWDDHVEFACFQFFDVEDVVDETNQSDSVALGDTHYLFDLVRQDTHGTYREQSQ